MNNIVKDTVEKFIEIIEKINPEDFNAGFSLSNKNFVSKRKYNGFNQIYLSMIRAHFKYPSCDWLTFNQVNKLNGSVKSGEKSSVVLFSGITYTFISKSGERIYANDEDSVEFTKRGEAIVNSVLCSVSSAYSYRIHRVFNVAQTTGIDLTIDEYNDGKLVIDNQEIVNDIYRYILINNITIKDTTSSCHYNPKMDSIAIPPMPVFRHQDKFLEALIHEAIHSTGIESRLNRYNAKEISNNSQEYAVEECIAEIGSMMFLNERGIFSSDLNMAAYLKYWVNRDKEFIMSHIFEIVSQAQKAVNLINKASNNRADTNGC